METYTLYIMNDCTENFEGEKTLMDFGQNKASLHTTTTKRTHTANTVDVKEFSDSDASTSFCFAAVSSLHVFICVCVCVEHTL